MPSASMPFLFLASALPAADPLVQNAPMLGDISLHASQRICARDGFKDFCPNASHGSSAPRARLAPLDADGTSVRSRVDFGFLAGVVVATADAGRFSSTSLSAATLSLRFCAASAFTRFSFSKSTASCRSSPSSVPKAGPWSPPTLAFGRYSIYTAAALLSRSNSRALSWRAALSA